MSTEIIQRPKFIFWVGQRGVGKTSLLKRLKAALSASHSSVVWMDLDQEVQARSGLPIEMIFEQEGEAGFRKRERETLEKVVAERDAIAGSQTVIVLGAGFEADSLEVFSRPDTEVVWIQRPTDTQGRIFLDRPRLNPEMPPLEEYRSRASFRARRFERISHTVCVLEEGEGNFSEESDATEKRWFLRVAGLEPHQPRPLAAGASWIAETWLPSASEKTPKRERLLKRLQRGVDVIELRTDLLTEPMAWSEVADLPVLLSWRTPDARQKLFATVAAHLSNFKEDWALELGEIPSDCTPAIVSLHERKEGESLAQALDRLVSNSPKTTRLLKAAPLIESFSDLLVGHQWWMQDPERRVFLPRSQAGEWKFYRLWTANKQPLQFVRGQSASAPDQPTLQEFERVIQPLCPRWGAVIGDPVAHSQSPLLHRAYFQSRGMEYFAVKVPEAGGKAGFEEALRVLTRLGARCFSVTAPWKEIAHGYVSEGRGEVLPRAQRLRSCNTLYFAPSPSLSGTGHWTADNTDLPGFRAAAREVARRLGLREHRTLEDVAVWGGGGTLATIREEFPVALFFSARTGDFKGTKPSLYDSASEFRPRILIWALSRGRMETGARWPHREWHPDWIVDLNYSEDSPGREAAQRMGARYLSGMQMFKTQGQEQQLFWHERLKNEKQEG